MKRTVFRIILILLLIGTSLLAFDAELKAIPETILYVNPSATVVFEGNIFSINVTVKDVFDLFAFEFCLGYNTTVLDALTLIVLPPFNEGPIIINDAEGYVQVSGSLLPGEPGLSGSFPLVTITFKAAYLGISMIPI
ncbi:MAG: cohesin domain-containing protein [Candidatus Bathyarchaeota archaeon]|jgi:hypothetical protein|nr:cohesin domain-containing protein [Candidatus Bathyarchaeota archaeon]